LLKLIPNAVNDNIAKTLHKYWDDGEIVEILAVISLFGYLNRWNNAMATTMEGDAIDAGEKRLNDTDWSRGKHV
jgi:hypothetical protein